MIEIPLALVVIGMLLGSVAIVANMVALIMVGKINERVPADQKVSYIWWDGRVLKRYATLYPHSRLPFLFRGLEVLLVLTFLAGAWFFV